MVLLTFQGRNVTLNSNETLDNILNRFTNGLEAYYRTGGK